MKKTSILLTVLLVVSLLFAVSCPNKDPSINVTSDKSAIEKNLQDVDKNISFNVTIDIAHDTFSDKVAPDANVIDWFTLSDGTETEKATLTSATVSSVSEKKDSVAVDIVAETKAVTEANKPVKLIVAIPEATADVVWTTTKKAIKEAKANAIAITIVDKAKVTASITSGNPVSFTVGQADVEKKVTVALENGTFASTEGISVTRADGAGISHIEFNGYTIGTNENANELSITVKSLTDIAQEDAGVFKINIPSSAITPSSGDYIKTDISVELTVGVGGTVKIKAAKGAYVWLTDEGQVPLYGNSDPLEISGYKDVYFADFPIKVEGAKFNDALFSTDNTLYKNEFNMKYSFGDITKMNLYVSNKNDWGELGYLRKGEEEGLYYVRVYVSKDYGPAEKESYINFLYITPEALVPNDGWTNISRTAYVRIVLWGLPIKIVCDDTDISVQQGGTISTTFTIKEGGTWNQNVEKGPLLINDDERIKDATSGSIIDGVSYRVENQGFTYAFEKVPEDDTKVKLTIAAAENVPAATYDKSLLVREMLDEDKVPITFDSNFPYGPWSNATYYLDGTLSDIHSVPFKLTVTAK